MGHPNAWLGTLKSLVASDTNWPQNVWPSSMVPDALRESDSFAITDVGLDAMTEAYATMQMSAQIDQTSMEA